MIVINADISAVTYRPPQSPYQVWSRQGAAYIRLRFIPDHNFSVSKSCRLCLYHSVDSSKQQTSIDLRAAFVTSLVEREFEFYASSLLKSTEVLFGQGERWRTFRASGAESYRALWDFSWSQRGLVRASKKVDEAVGLFDLDICSVISRTFGSFGNLSEADAHRDFDVLRSHHGLIFSAADELAIIATIRDIIAALVPAEVKLRTTVYHGKLITSVRDQRKPVYDFEIHTGASPPLLFLMAVDPGKYPLPNSQMRRSFSEKISRRAYRIDFQYRLRRRSAGSSQQTGSYNALCYERGRRASRLNHLRRYYSVDRSSRAIRDAGQRQMVFDLCLGRRSEGCFGNQARTKMRWKR